MTKILPCPFCGRTPRPKVGHQRITYIICDGCGAVVSFAKPEAGPPYATAHALDKFNTRAPLPNSLP